MSALQRPAIEELKDTVLRAFEAWIDEAVITHGELTLVSKATYVRDLIAGLRNHPLCKFDQLIDLCGVDWPDRRQRFEIVYHLLSMRENLRVRVKIALGLEETAPSLIDLFPVANWLEREAFDMYGVIFSGHPDLRRILTDYGFEGFPLRKEFPLTGHVEVRYDAEQQRVVYEPVKLVQEYRNFDFESPWEGMVRALPGDEKAREQK
ncbi:MAG TPA: NADH-quinone oxidoreductase subunit C [Hyphomonadaceae bacterium]|jgi:NADH dehydrogenase subunit C (EC 1.6.5.3)|nr:NADH-quinone oxidoreductase subunit C [Hyphomonadaceae bacterium]